MKKQVIWIVLAVIAAVTCLVLPLKAKCAWCPTYSCFGNDCGRGCICMMDGMDMQGKCVSFR